MRSGRHPPGCSQTTTEVVTRYGRPITGIRFNRDGIDAESFAGIGMVPPGDTDVALGRKRARAAVLLELALPGGAYVYQGDELGLEEVEDLPEDVLQDPVWKRSATPYVGATAAECRFRGRHGAAARIRVCGASALATAACTLGRPDRRRARGSPGQHAEPVSGRTRRTSAKPRVGARHPDLGRRRAGRGAVVQPRARLPVRGLNFGPGRYEIPEGAEVLVSSGLSVLVRWGWTRRSVRV